MSEMRIDRAMERIAELECENGRLRIFESRYEYVKPILAAEDDAEPNSRLLGIAAGLMRNEPLDTIVDGLLAAVAATAEPAKGE